MTKFARSGPRHQVMSTSKVAIGWAITVVCFVHAVVTAMEVLNINRTAQLAGKARLLTKTEVNDSGAQEMAEDDSDVDDAMFHQDPVVPEGKCV
jgi:hypothetical protein